MAATAASPPLPPRPPGARKALREKGEGGTLTKVRLLSMASVASPALRAPAGGSSARAHALCARALRPSLRRALPRPHLAGLQLVLVSAAALSGDARPRSGGAGVVSPSAAFASVFPRGASTSEFAYPRLPPW